MKQLLLFGGLLFALVQQASAQTRQVSGKVSDKKGEALIGVSVIIKGESKGTTTDLSGNYRITVPSSSKVLVFKYLGFLSKEVNIGTSTKNRRNTGGCGKQPGGSGGYRLWYS